jgi:hypothetical protein
MKPNLMVKSTSEYRDLSDDEAANSTPGYGGGMMGGR